MSLVVERIPGPKCPWCGYKGCLVCTAANVVKEIRLVFHMHDWCDVDEVLDQIKTADAFDKVKAMIFVEAASPAPRPRRPPQWGQPGYVGSDDDDIPPPPTKPRRITGDPDIQRHIDTLDRYKDDYSLVAHEAKMHASNELRRIEAMTTNIRNLLERQAPGTPPKPVVLAFLQNTWVKEPDRVRALFERCPEQRNDIIARLLFMGGRSGQILGLHFAPWLEHFVWEECSTEITGSPSDKVTPDPAHMLAAFQRIKPCLVLTFGTLAREGWEKIPSADTNGQGALHGSHPTARSARVGWEPMKEALDARWPLTPKPEPIECPACGGWGFIDNPPAGHRPIDMPPTRECAACDGTGKTAPALL